MTNPLLLSTLADSGDQLEIKWGAQVVVAPKEGATLRFTGDVPARVFYDYAGGSGELRGSWKVEAGDGPAVLTIVQSDDEDAELEDLLAQGLPTALYLVTVADSGENG